MISKDRSGGCNVMGFFDVVLGLKINFVKSLLTTIGEVAQPEILAENFVCRRETPYDVSSIRNIFEMEEYLGSKVRLRSGVESLVYRGGGGWRG